MPAVHAMELSQMLTQAMFTSESYLKQLPHCSAPLLERCKEKVSCIFLFKRFFDLFLLVFVSGENLRVLCQSKIT